MKNKHIIALAALIAAFTVNAFAGITENIGSNPILFPATLAAGTTNYPPASAPYIDTSKQKDATFSSTITASTVGATNIYTLVPTTDGINFSTTPGDYVLITNACLSATFTNTVSVKFNCGSENGYRVNSIVTTGTATNNAASYSNKAGFP